jgi:hypothetical protein
MKSPPSKKPKKGDPLFDGFVSQDEYSCVFRLVIYQTHDEMIKGMNNWRAHHGIQLDPDQDYLGVCFSEVPKPKIIEDSDGLEQLMFGVMFLNAEDLGEDPFVPVHESLHMVIDRERSVFRYEGSYGDRLQNGNDPEERICYCLEDFTKKVYKSILKVCPDIFERMRVNLLEKTE